MKNLTSNTIILLAIASLLIISCTGKRYSFRHTIAVKNAETNQRKPSVHLPVKAVEHSVSSTSTHDLPEAAQQADGKSLSSRGEPVVASVVPVVNEARVRLPHLRPVFQSTRMRLQKSSLPKPVVMDDSNKLGTMSLVSAVTSAVLYMGALYFGFRESVWLALGISFITGMFALIGGIIATRLAKKGKIAKLQGLHGRIAFITGIVVLGLIVVLMVAALLFLFAWILGAGMH